MEQQTLPSLSSFTCDWAYDHQRGIQTFIDDEEIQKGDEITPTLLQAIKESRIFIAIFSPNYASSTFCLTELVTILECSKLQGRLFLPVFYDVNPSHVRNITGTYAEAFVKHDVRFAEEKEKVQKWRDALRQAANISGWHFEHFLHFTPGSESEYKFIGKIVEEVSIKINRAPLHVANKPIGLESRMLEVTSLLRLESGERVSMIGIYGIGGIGKSTTARAVHNLIADQFDGVCFLTDIREREIHHGLVQLQETLLSEILGEKDIKVGDVYKGISIIKRRLQRKKVLLILDNVDKEKQLQALVGGHDWFGFGSKIIITTRDKHLLATHGVVKVYEVKQLENEKALDLFSWHAFKNKNIDPCYWDIAKRAVSYCHGLPLALEVIGSQLFGKSLAVWESSLDKYAGVLRKDIHEILKVSYDDLEEDVKGIFLDIACFFNSYDIGYVKEILYHHGFHAEDGIQELTDKCLMKIDVNGRVRMHDLIRDMGREIVRQESPLEPGRRSRLWFSDDIVHVLEENTGTDTIEVIIVDLHKDRKVNWCGDAFGQMKNLRILIIRNAQFSSGPQILPNSLRVLDWYGYQSSSLPSSFNGKNLAVFETLNFLNFEGCKFLIEVPSLSSVPNLGALCLDDCTNLNRIHDSVGFLDKLVSLSAQDCTQLENLVPSINLPSLVTLDLSGCSRLESFPEVLGVMENIKDVYLDHTSIKQFPSTIGNLVGLQHLFLRGCFQLPSYILPKVEIITTYGCGGFQSSENEEKVNPKVFANAMCVYNEYRKTFLNVYSSNNCSNNVIEVCSPLENDRGKNLVIDEFETTLFRHREGRIKLESERNKSGKGFKLKVLINGTTQLASSCEYIFYSQKETEHMLCCDLQCKVEGVFSKNEWNWVEILCEMEHLMPCDSKRVTTHRDWTTTTILKWSLLYVYPENEEDDFTLFDSHDFPSVSKKLKMIALYKLQDILPNIIHQLGPDNLENLKKLAEAGADATTAKSCPKGDF
ncbi:nascent polypeptide-associated complex beta subunit [Trifolium repens]|nr:nascent polypeptide-associated complex beta subunit [Trifolium repens]